MQNQQPTCFKKPSFHILTSHVWDHYLEKPALLLDQNTLHPDLKVITVLSTGSGLMKSLTALHLAESYAQQGYKTLLMEANVRNPVFHTLFTLEDTKGLTDHISGNPLPITRYKPGLDLVCGGTPTLNVATFLLSRELKQCIHALKGRYDKIIIDTPDLSDHKDALILNDYACGSVIVHDSHDVS